jgi:SPP1 gp7 family putative phage head morphogenesis protein
VNVPILSKRRANERAAIREEAMQKAMSAVTEAVGWTGQAQKSFLGGTQGLGSTGMGGAATMLSARSSQSVPGGRPTNQMQQALIARVTQNLTSEFGKAPEQLELALAEQGLSWGPPFPPGRPLDPFFGYRRPPRTYDYAVGENVQITPRWERISFDTIHALWNSYDVAQICTRHLINDVRSLEFAWNPMPGIKDDVSEDIRAAEEFFEYPDKRLPFRAWLAKWLQDVIKYDAGALYIRRSMDGSPLALEVVSGKTVIPLVDYYGRRPEDEDDEETPDELFDGTVTPAFVQIIHGLPWVWLAADDLLYLPWNPEPESQYGRAPLEAVLLSASTDLRFQQHFLEYFTDGSQTAGYMEAPPDMSDPAQLKQWQDTWDAFMLGDPSMLNKVRWVPTGAKFTESKPDGNKFDSEFPLYLMRRTCAAHGITPNDLGFTENVNKSSGDTQIDVQFRVGTAPLLRYCEDVINLFTHQYLKLRVNIKFDDGRETEDRVATATAMGIYIDHGVISPDTVAQELGYPVDKTKPTGRFVNNARVGPVPLISLQSMAGKIDPETYAPASDQELISTPFAAPPGVIPPQGTPEQLASSEHTAQVARDLVESTTGKPPSSDTPDAPIVPPGTTADAGSSSKPEQGNADEPADAATKAALAKALDAISRDVVKKYLPQFDDEEVSVEGKSGLFVQMVHDGVIALSEEPGGEAVMLVSEGEVEPVEGPFVEVSPDVFEAVKRLAGGVDNTGGPGVHPTTTITGGTDGITVTSDSNNFLDEDEDDDEVEQAYTDVALKRWRNNARNRLKKGQAPRKFVDPKLPDTLHAEVWSKLSTASTREEVDAAFADVGRPKAPAGSRPAFHSQAQAITDYYAPKIHDALADMFSATAIDEAIKAAYATKVEKSVGPPPNLRPSENSLQRCVNCCLFAHPVCVKYGDWPVEPDQTCDGWELAIDDHPDEPVIKDLSPEVQAARRAAAKSLTSAVGSSSELKTVLYSLYGDSFLQGAHDAALAVGGSPTTGVHGVTGMPDGYWDKWQPGYGEAAARAADGGMREMLDASDITIKGMTDASIDRIGNTISDGLASGASYESTAKAIADMIGETGRASTIADTEYARAMTEASMSTYRELEVERKEFMAESDACPECQENEDAGTIPIDEEFPNGDVPVHPNCRCAIAPVIDLGGGSE